MRYKSLSSSSGIGLLSTASRVVYCFDPKAVAMVAMVQQKVVRCMRQGDNTNIIFDNDILTTYNTSTCGDGLT